MRNNKGFTLIELVMVVVIIGILLAVAIPKFVNLSATAEKSQCEMIRADVAAACSMYYAEEAAKGRVPVFPPDEKFLSPLIKGGWKKTCPGGKGAEYTYSPVSGTIKCSNPVHNFKDE